jgi:hypothetical protein
MFSSKNFISRIQDVPAKWIFEKYFGLTEPLKGQKVTINSIFNSEDKTPSMVLYFNTDHQEYRFKDFSSGEFGEAINAVTHMWNTNYGEACTRVVKDYESYLADGNVHIEPFKIARNLAKQSAKWRVVNIKYRPFNTRDVEYWTAFNIGSVLLNTYEVKPIESYTMEQVLDDKVVNSFESKGLNQYGYHAKGELYKIYHPKNKDRKFIKVKDHIQGSDKITRQPTLIIASSLKDCMSIKSLGLRVDVIAPDSENTLLTEEQIKVLQKTYKNIVTLLDSDEAGINAMQKYKEKYDIPFVYLPLEKDISDIVKFHGKDRAIVELVPKLNRILDAALVK